MTQSTFIRRTVALLVLTICILSWIALGSTFVFDLPREVKIAAVFAAAFSTEGLLWVAAALLGWKVFENFSFWSRITGCRTKAET